MNVQLAGGGGGGGGGGAAELKYSARTPSHGLPVLPFSVPLTEGVVCTTTETPGVPQAEAEMAVALSGAGGPWQEEEQTPEATLEQKRREAMAERLRQLAKNKPDAVAEVLKGWINQPVR